MHNTLQGIIVPADVDVFCGKTSTTRQHPGNVFFRKLVLSKVGDYMLSAKRKSHKGLIVAGIVKELESNGARFLKIDEASKQWRIISAADARSKVSHAIRDRISEHKARKSILPDLSVIMTSNEKTSKNNSKKAFSKKKTYRKQSLTDVNNKVVLQGNEDVLALQAVIGIHSRVVSEDDESAATADESYLSFPPPSYLTAQHASCPLFIGVIPEPICSYLDPCDLMLDDADHLLSIFGDDDGDYDGDDGDHDDVQDSNNDPSMLSDIPSHQEE